MKAEINFSALEDCRKRIEEMGRKGAKLENKALEAGADIILKEIIKNSPYRTGKSRKFLKLSKPKKEKGQKNINIGIQKDDNSEAFYLKFYEYGTSKQTAKPFMRPAFLKKRKEAVNKTIEVLKEGLE